MITITEFMEVILVKKVALIIAEKVFRDEEYKIPKEVFEHAGMKVVTVSTTKQTAVGKLGLEVKPDALITEIQATDFDAVVFIGGGGAKQYFDDPTAHALALDTMQQDKLLGAICIAPVILANAGLLRGKRATVFPDGEDMLNEGGAHYTGKRVEVDGRIITGNGPDAAEEFAETILKRL